MTIRSLHLMGDPVLRIPSDAIANPQSAAVRLVADDLQETLRHLRSQRGMGRGLAAPQIGAPMRMIYIEIDRPWFILNPIVTDIGDEDFWVWDDCFSLPDLLVRVQRAYQIEVVYQDLAGQRHGVKALGALAELLQHEIDHLDGVLSVDRPTGLNAFSYQQEWEQFHSNDGRYGEPELRVAERDYFIGMPTPHDSPPLLA
jgi:peptide deformylase